MLFQKPIRAIRNFDMGVCAMPTQVTLGRVTTADATPFWQRDFKAVVMAMPTAPGTAGLVGLTLLNACAAVAFDW